MADKKITELTPTTGANLSNADEFVVVDVSADETKSVTRAEFFKNTPSIISSGTLSSSAASGYGTVEVGGPSGGLIDLKAPSSDDYDARIIYNAGTNLQIITLADEPIVLQQGGATKLATTATGVDVTGLLELSATTGSGSLNLVSTVNVADAGQKIAFFGAGRSESDEEMAYIRGLLVGNSGGAGNVQSGHLAFGTSGSEAMRIDSSGNVGIGTSSINARADVSSTSTSQTTLKVKNSGSNPSQVLIGFDGTSANYFDGNTQVFRNGAGSTEAMRIDASQNVLVGTTSLAVFSDTNDGVMMEPSGAVVASRNSNTVGFFRRRGTDGGVFTFLKDTTAVGSISVTGSATAYNTSSDYRLKEDWVPMSGASERVQALKPVNFAWKVDASRVDGFLAHELAEVIPEAVSGAKDAMQDEEYEVTPAVLDEDGSETSPAVMATRSVPDMQGIDQSKIVPLLTAALQEALTKIADLETRLTALEA